MQDHLCEYGCGLEAKHQLKNGKWCCSTHWLKCKGSYSKSAFAKCNAKICNCKFCNREIILVSLKLHERTCKLNPNRIQRVVKRSIRTCEICKKNIASINYKRHIEAHSRRNNVVENNLQYTIDGDRYICNLCGKKFSNKGIGTHIWRCHNEKGKSRKRCFGSGIPWNKGKTCKTNPELSKSLCAGMKRLNELYDSGVVERKLHSEETKLMMSNNKKEFYKKFPEKHPNRKLASNHSKLSYPERLAIEFLNEKCIRYESQKRIHSFYPDITIEDKKLIIEVDGEFWHKGNKDEYNKNREKILKEQYGYNIERIHASNVIKELESVLVKYELLSLVG